MILRGLVKMLLFFVPLWSIDVYQIVGGRPVPISRMLVSRKASEFRFKQGIYDLTWAATKPGFVLAGTMSFLWQGSGGGMTPLPLGWKPYLDEYHADREAVRKTPIYDEETDSLVMMPSLDYKIAHRLINREHVEGWYNPSKYQKLMTLFKVAVICILVLAFGLAYVGSTPHIVKDCYNPHNTNNFTQWTPLLCPSAATVTSSSSSSTSTGVYIVPAGSP